MYRFYFFSFFRNERRSDPGVRFRADADILSEEQGVADLAMRILMDLPTGAVARQMELKQNQKPLFC